MKIVVFAACHGNIVHSATYSKPFVRGGQRGHAIAQPLSYHRRMHAELAVRKDVSFLRLRRFWPAHRTQSLEIGGVLCSTASGQHKNLRLRVL